MVTSFDRRQTLKRKREESSEPFIDDSHEKGLRGDNVGHKEQPSASEFQQLQPFYEEAMKHRAAYRIWGPRALTRNEALDHTCGGYCVKHNWHTLCYY